MAQACVKGTEKGSMAQALGIKAGDVLLSVNGNEIRDVFDYRFFCAEEHLVLRFRTKGGEEVTVEAEKEAEEDLGIIFESGLMDEAKRCSNGCVFCFIDQLPPGMRDTLYFKDDDARLSFLHGNYVTLTNLSDEDIDRIIKMKISVINVSVHTTDPDLRVKMLRNKFAGNLMPRLNKLAKSGITVNTQVVLCPGINDGEALSHTIGDLLSLAPGVYSLSVVPVGLTKYREGLCPLRPFTGEEAKKIIRQVTSWQEKALQTIGRRFVYLADEFYLLADLPIPPAEEYEGFPQIENGVGLIASLKEEWDAAIKEAPGRIRKREISMITGMAAAPFLQTLVEEAMAKYPRLTVHLYPIRNDFFGEKITVSGLLTGRDVLSQLQGKPLGKELLIPECMLRYETEDFLDDMTLSELQKKLKVKIRPVRNDGWELLSHILKG